MKTYQVKKQNKDIIGKNQLVQHLSNKTAQNFIKIKKRIFFAKAVSKKNKLHRETV